MTLNPINQTYPWLFLLLLNQNWNLFVGIVGVFIQWRIVSKLGVLWKGGMMRYWLQGLQDLLRLMSQWWMLGIQDLAQTMTISRLWTLWVSTYQPCLLPDCFLPNPSPILLMPCQWSLSPLTMSLPSSHPHISSYQGSLRIPCSTLCVLNTLFTIEASSGLMIQLVLNLLGPPIVVPLKCWQQVMSNFSWPLTMDMELWFMLIGHSGIAYMCPTAQ